MCNSKRDYIQFKFYLYKKTISRYGNLKDLDMNLLSARIDINLINKIETSLQEHTNQGRFRI